MKKKSLVSIFLILASFNLAACSYKEFAKTHQEFAKTERERFKQTPVVFTNILTQVVAIFSKTVESSIPELESKKALFTKTTTLPNGEVVEEHVYSEMDIFVAYLQERERVQARKETIQFVLPFIERIMTQRQMELDRPIEAGDVLLEIAKNTPLIATVLGFYGVTGQLADKVGNNITSTLNNGSAINIGSRETTSTSTSAIFEAATEE